MITRTLAILLVNALYAASIAATFHVAKSGMDTNSGSEAAPYLTISKAAAVVQPGDTVVVHPGTYSERVTTVRGGTNDRRIAFKAVGEVIMPGFVVGHPFITIDGFQITGHSHPNRNIGYITIQAAAHDCQVVNNRIRDGIAIASSDLVFADNDGSDDTISSASGGFTSAGFMPGMVLHILLPATQVSLLNIGTNTIQSVTDSVITLAPGQNLTNQGPIAAYLDASFNYGIYLAVGNSNCLIQSNIFVNLSYDAAILLGNNYLFEGNLIERSNGWEALHFGGHNGIIRRNFIRSSPILTRSNLSPDVFETFAGTPTSGIVIEDNFVYDVDGVLGIIRQSNLNVMRDITFRRNVFFKAGFFQIYVPEVKFVNNTFVRVAEGPTPGAQAVPHPLQFSNVPGGVGAHHGVVRNNIFVSSGRLERDANLHGWYEIQNVTNFLAEGNFVAGPAPEFAPKIGFNEGDPDLNGGDPGFVNINDPLGPDGLPFTFDDGLRLRADSKLRGQGIGGADIGAYQGPEMPPELNIEKAAPESIKVSWPQMSGFRLQASSTLMDGWSNVTQTIETTDGINSIRLVTGAQAAFFRLVK